MKKCSQVLACLTLLIGVSYGQLSEKLSLVISGGAAVPVESFALNPPNILQSPPELIAGIPTSTENFQEFWNTGLNLNAGLEYKITRNFSLLGRFDLNRFVLNNSKFENELARVIKPLFDEFQIPFDRSVLEADRGDINIYTISLNLKAGISLGALYPYLFGGGGYMLVDQEDIDFSYIADEASFFDRFVGRNESDLLGNAGAGIIFNLSRNVKPFVQGDYMTGLSGDSDTIAYAVKFGFFLGLGQAKQQ